MPIHPHAQEFMDIRTAAGSRPVSELTVEQSRQQSMNLLYLGGEAPSVYRVEDRTIPGPNCDIPVRIYTPGPDGPWPALVYFHGGGWVVGNLETTHVACAQLANAVSCVVVSVNYRHGPEDKFPAAAEDAYAATQWVAENVADLNVDASRIAVGGSSAGGNLAAVVALMTRDRGGAPLVHQLLTVPVTDYSFATSSYTDNAEGYGLTHANMIWFWNHYLADPADGANPYASPLRAPDLTGLVPAHVLTAEYDPLRDEGNAYAARLAEAGVPTNHTYCEGMIHGYLGPDAFDAMVAGLRAAFA